VSAECVDGYSRWSAARGSTRMARRAGSQQAAKAMTVTASRTPPTRNLLRAGVGPVSMRAMVQPIEAQLPPKEGRAIPLFGGEALPDGLSPNWMLLVGALAFGVLTVDYGFNLGSSMGLWVHGLEVLLSGIFLLDRVMMLRRGRNWLRVLRQRSFEFGVFAVLAGLGLLVFVREPWMLWWLALLGLEGWQQLGVELLKLFLLANVLIQILRQQQRILLKGIRPEWILAGSFALLILAGTLLLLLPRASAVTENPIRPMDALFTATSAACVTGLVVRDPGTEFSVLGQAIILALVQAGGLGIMTFVAFLALTSARSLPIANTLALKHLLSTSSISEMKRHIWVVLVFTIAVELAGAVMLYVWLPGKDDPLAAAGWSVFHSVSAFCNAGFALERDSLIAYQGQPGVLLTIMGLIVLGGLGFLVVTDVVGIQLTRWPLIRKVPMVRRFNRRVPVYRLPMQTRISLVVTGLMLVLGVVGFWWLESGHLLAGEPWWERLGIATFQSVTSRTAGFNTVAMDALQPATLLLLMALMVVGASPVSTGGGIKTVTLGVLVLAMRALLTGRERVEAFGRSLPQKVVFAALSVVVLYAVTAGLGVFALSLFDPGIPLQDQAFEVISALSTVGLSTGITAELSTGSQLVLCGLMFIGRVGPLSLVLSMFRGTPNLRYQYPEEELVVG
jgi:trk system potassium uptake protein